MFHVQLIDDFRTKYFKFWSTRLHAIASVCSALEILNTLGPLFFPALEHFVPPGVMAAISFVFIMFGMLARGMKQVWPELESLPQEPMLPPDMVGESNDKAAY